MSRIRALLLILSVVLGLGLAACGSDSCVHRCIPESYTYEVNQNERRDIAGHADATAKVLTDAGYSVTGRISPANRRDGDAPWQALLTRCGANPGSDAAEKCNDAKATIDKPHVLRNYPGNYADDYRIKGYSGNGTEILVDLGVASCTTKAPVTKNAFQALPGVARKYAGQKPGTAFQVPQGGDPVFACFTG